MVRILVIGNGFLGSTVCSASKTRGLEVSMGSQSAGIRMDIRQIETVENAVRRTDPDTIINCAAVTELDTIEKNPDDAYEVNGHGAGNIAKIASKYSKRLIHISTDSVFDGKKGSYSETDDLNPINEYGRSKKVGEELVMENSENSVVVRTNFYGSHPEGKFLFNWILDNLKKGRRFNGFTNIIFNPLEVENLSEGLVELAQLEYTGLLHMSSDQTYSKHEFAITVAKKLGYDSGLIMEETLQDTELVARRPHNTTLDNSLAKKILSTKQIALESWLERTARD